MDPWYYLTCPGCRSRLRIKSAYTHMRGRCPTCGLRIEPPIPKPLKLTDEPGGLVPEDEHWPEPATLLEEAESGTEATYGVSASESPTRRTEPEPEEEQGGVYTIAFDPNAPKTPGISRSAEWEQGQAPMTDRPTPAVLSAAAPPLGSSGPAPIFAELADEEPPAAAALVPTPSPTTPHTAYETVVDPLFGDVVQIPKPVEERKPPPPVAMPAVKPAIPMARLASPTDSAVEKSRPPVPPSEEAPPSLPIKPRTKPKRPVPQAEAGEAAAETPERPADDPAADARHIYRLSLAEENRITPDPPPKSVFFEGVFEFAWAAGNRLFLFWMILGVTLLLVPLRMIYKLADMGSSFGMMGIAGFGMAALWIFVWTFSYGCAGLLNTVTYTAAGSRTVRWPDEGWRDWFPALLKVGYYWIIAMAIGSLANLLGLGIYGWLVVTLFLFPFFLFSGMASMTFWNFINEDIFKETVAKLPQYFTFYALSLLVMMPALALAGVAVSFDMFFVLLAGPVFAVAWIIYSRLLGRMAYLLQSDGVKKRRRRRRKKKEEEAEEDAPKTETTTLPPASPADEPIRMVE